MSGPVAVLVSLAAVGLSAFFVAVEFALVAARRHRLAEAARTSRAARAALRGTRELSLLLAGAQLGITLCTLVLGAVTKPAVHDVLLGPLTAAGVPGGVADRLSFVLALLVVTFLHLVVGEMAPKSWAIAHPEHSAIRLALPMRGFLWLTRPALLLLNGWADRLLRLVGVTPVDEPVDGHGPGALRALLEHSGRTGTLDRGRAARLTAALDRYAGPVGAQVRPAGDIVRVPVTAGIGEIRAAAGDHSRLVVQAGDDPVGVVHVRDTLGAGPGATAGALMRPVTRLAADTPWYAAIGALRAQRSQLALVYRGDELAGLVTLADLLDRLPSLERPGEPAGPGSPAACTAPPAG